MSLRGNRIRQGLLVVALAAAMHEPARASAGDLSRAQFQALLQKFVSQAYLKGFRRLGEERDFDHGHILYGAGARPVAILYHTQELAGESSQAGLSRRLDPEERNWIQWIKDGRVENARRYLRRSYPGTPEWELFRLSELPALRRRRTITDKMLSPSALAIDPEKSRQWVFTRIPCRGPSASGSSIAVVLPTRERVCLSLTED